MIYNNPGILCTFGIILLQISQGTYFIRGLNKRIEEFQVCNVRITTYVLRQETDFETFTFPLVLTDTWVRYDFLAMHDIWSIRIHKTIHLFHFKYRESICTLDLILHIHNKTYDPNFYFHEFYQLHEYMNDKYLIVIQEQNKFLEENHMNFLYFRPLRDHKIFFWTVNQDLNHTKNTYFSFSSIYLICLFYENRMHMHSIHLLGNQDQNSTTRSQMDSFAFRIRRHIFGNTRVKYSRKVTNNGRVGRPYDDESSESHLDFTQFIYNLLWYNNSGLLDSETIQSIKYDSFQLISSMLNPGQGKLYVSDETEGFSFITCVTSDTIWSIAKLFSQPYQPAVWIALVFILGLTVVVLIAIKILGKFQLSVSKLVCCLVGNLIEMGVDPGNIRGRRVILIIMPVWFLMSIILTNSYKGLIISYLSIPWEPQQDFDYFEQLKDFRFYSRISKIRDKDYWDMCGEVNWTYFQYQPELTSCAQLSFFPITAFGQLILKSDSERNTPNATIQYLPIFQNMTSEFPKNESEGIYNELISGSKVAIAGLNTEIDEILSELLSKFKGTTFFQGKEHYWLHTKKWEFPRITYSQPYRELVQLMAGGIYQFWKYWIRDRKFIEAQLKDENLAEPEPLSLSSKVSFMYVVLIFGLIMAGTVFLVENVNFESRKYNLKHKFTLAYARLRNLYLIVKSWLTKCRCRIWNFNLFSKSTTVTNLRNM